MEYMMLGKAVVAYDLEESKVSGGDAVLYVAENSSEALADAIENLADNREKIEDMARKGLARVQSKLAWHYQAVNLVNVYKKLFPQAGLIPCNGMSENNE